MRLLLFLVALLSTQPVVVYSSNGCSPGQAPDSVVPTGQLPETITCNSNNDSKLRISTSLTYTTPTFDSDAEVEGRIEMCHDYFGYWHWFSFYGASTYYYDDVDAQVLCRQLANQHGYLYLEGSAVSKSSTVQGPSNQCDGPYSMGCVGDESYLYECYHKWDSSCLTTDNDGGIKCKFSGAGSGSGSGSGGACSDCKWFFQLGTSLHLHMQVE